MEKRLLEVGDKILIENWMNKYILTITRVTKTKAVAKVIRKDGSSYEYTFKREVNNGWVSPKPHINFDATKRTLITEN